MLKSGEAEKKATRALPATDWRDWRLYIHSSLLREVKLSASLDNFKPQRGDLTFSLASVPRIGSMSKTPLNQVKGDVILDSFVRAVRGRTWRGGRNPHV